MGSRSPSLGRLRLSLRALHFSLVALTTMTEDMGQGLTQVTEAHIRRLEVTVLVVMIMAAAVA